MYDGITCGTHFGETKLVVSITGSPDRDNWFISSILTVVGTISYNQSTILLTSNMHYYLDSDSILTTHSSGFHKWVTRPILLLPYRP